VLNRATLTLLLSTGIAFSAAAEVRTWTDTTGRTIQAELVSTIGESQVVIERHPDKTRFTLALERLSAADREFVRRYRETKPLRDAGYLELSTKLIENFPEKVDQKVGWMDCEFLGLSADELKSFLPNSVYISIGFHARDNNGDMFIWFIADKKLFTEKLMSLKSGQRIRVVGKVAGMMTSHHWIVVDQITIVAP
jgi:hypothetical protein